MTRERRRAPTRAGGPFAAGLALLVALSFAEPLRAQGGIELPAEVAAELVDFYNHGATLRMSGASRIASGTEIHGGVAVLGGPIRVAGRIQGRLVVINGDLILEPGADLEGDLTVVGGVVRGLDEVAVDGAVVIYRAPLRFRTLGDRIAVAPPELEPELVTGREFGFLRTDLTVAARRGYNRVEGLPVVAGPRFETLGENPLRFEMLAIYRTVSGFDLEPRKLGYLVQLERSFGERAVWLGGSLYSEVQPIESMGLSDRENSLAAFILHRDYRDHYEREGWGAHLRVTPRGRPFDFALEFRNERHAAVDEEDPWTLFRGGERWRPQPMIAVGQLRSITLRTQLDTRNEGTDPTTGWLVQSWVERGLGGSLKRPAPLPVDLPGPLGLVTPLEVSTETEFATGVLDLRRYARMGPGSRLALRAVAASSLNDRPLPPQRQRLLGGAGTLPGYASHQFDCGARLEAEQYADGVFYPYYGCDRVALFQIEFRNDFSFGRGWGRKLGRDIDLGERLGWIVFFDAGRAWVEREAAAGRTTGADDFAADLGLGLRIGRLGLYWAMPLSGHDRDLHFSLRLGPRF